MSGYKLLITELSYFLKFIKILSFFTRVKKALFAGCCAKNTQKSYVQFEMPIRREMKMLCDVTNPICATFHDRLKTEFFVL